MPSPTDWQPALDTFDPTVRKAAQFCARLVADFDDCLHPRWLTLSGLPGTGKTMLAKQVFAKLQTMSSSYAFVKSRDFTDELYAGNYSIARMFERMQFVVFDDLGANRDKDGFITNALAEFAAIREGKWTLWTSNLDLAQIDALDPRLSSRLIRDGNQFVRITAPDYALRNRKQAA